MSLLTLPFGVLVGFSLGLTGGGGSIFTVPLLVYGLSTLPREAIVISLAAVGATAFMGFVQRLRTKEVELGTGLLFAAAGMLGAPVGSLLGGHIPDTLLLGLFALLMLLVASRMWVQTLRNPEEASAGRALPASESERRGPACKRDPHGKLSMTSRCALALTLAGLFQPDGYPPGSGYFASYNYSD